MSEKSNFPSPHLSTNSERPPFRHRCACRDETYWQSRRTGHNWVKTRYIDPNPLVINSSPEVPRRDRRRNQTVSLDRFSFLQSSEQHAPAPKRPDICSPASPIRLRGSGQNGLKAIGTLLMGLILPILPEATHGRPANIMRWAPPDAVRFRSFDWGSAKPFSVGWWVIANGKWPIKTHCPITPFSVIENGMAQTA